MSGGRVSGISEVTRKASPTLAIAVALAAVAAVLLVLQMGLLAQLVDDLAFKGLSIKAGARPLVGFFCVALMRGLSLIHISEPTRPVCSSRMPSSA